jgi:acylglycerol lipase
MYTEEFLAGNPPGNFYTRIYTPETKPKACLIFVHGFIEHIGRYTHVHERWASAGIAVFAFDLRGFGRSALEKDGKLRKVDGSGGYGRTNDKEQMLDVDWAIDTVSARYPDTPLFLMGHSMGGGILLSYISRHYNHKANLAGVILSSPCIALAHPPNGIVRHAGGLASHVYPKLTISAPVDPSALSHDKAVAEAFINDVLIHQKVEISCVDAMLSRVRTSPLFPKPMVVDDLNTKCDEFTAASTIKWPENLPVIPFYPPALLVANFSSY